MGLYAISDLHLSFAKEKPMDIFGEQWKNHSQKIKENWEKTITHEDTVLLPGDLSWGNNMEEAKEDLFFINSLPGKKILLSGNHDHWWHSTAKCSLAFPDMVFLKNSFFLYEGIAVCGSRGWICPNDTYFTQQDIKLYKREQTRLKMSLDAAMRMGQKEIFVMMHFPPTNDKKELSEFVSIFHQYPVKKVIYGHLHGENSFHSSYEGMVDGIEYHLVSCDYLDFKPKKILL